MTVHTPFRAEGLLLALGRSCGINRHVLRRQRNVLTGAHSICQCLTGQVSGIQREDTLFPRMTVVCRRLDFKLVLLFNA